MLGQCSAPRRGRGGRRCLIRRMLAERQEQKLLHRIRCGTHRLAAWHERLTRTKVHYSDGRCLGPRDCCCKNTHVCLCRDKGTVRGGSVSMNILRWGARYEEIYAVLAGLVLSRECMSATGLADNRARWASTELRAVEVGSWNLTYAVQMLL